MKQSAVLCLMHVFSLDALVPLGNDTKLYIKLSANKLNRQIKLRLSVLFIYLFIYIIFYLFIYF